MSKINAVLITIIGVVLVLQTGGWSAWAGALLNTWLVPILVLAVGIAKLKMSYGKKKR